MNPGILAIWELLKLNLPICSVLGFANETCIGPSYTGFKFIKEIGDGDIREGDFGT